MPVALLISATTLAACGGSSSKSSFVSKADSICTHTTSDVVAINLEAGPSSNAASAAALLSRTLPEQNRELAQLSALRAPSGSSSDFAAYLATVRSRVAITRQQLAAVQANKAAQYSSLGRQDAQLMQRQEQIGARLGFAACAGRLPADQQAAAREVVTRTSTTGAASQCTQDFTPSFVKASWGSLAKCVASQKKSQGVKSVTITQVTGVSEVLADVHFVEHGGPHTGTPVLAEVVKQNGRWQIALEGPG